MQDLPSAPTAQFQLRTIGGFSLWRADTSVPGGWSDTGLGEKPCAILAYLTWCVHEVTRAELAETFWEGTVSSRSRNSVRQALFRIRAQLGPKSVVEVGQGLRLTMPLDLDLPCLRRTVNTADCADAAPDALAQFGRSEIIRGRLFEQWCAQVRGGAPLLQVLPRLNGNGRHPSDGHRGGESFPGTRAGLAPRASAVTRWLFELWQLVQGGIPVSAWLTQEPDVDLALLMERLAARCRADGGRVAVLGSSTGFGYTAHALELDLWTVLRGMPGASGISPEHHAALMAGPRGTQESSMLLRAAIVELITAIAEDAPLLLVVEDPRRYSIGAMRELLSRLTVAEGCPVLVAITAPAGAPPVSPICLHLPATVTATATAS